MYAIILFLSTLTTRDSTLYTVLMITVNIDTFEHDISSEIKRKEATIGDIASATGNIGNTPAPHATSPFLILGVTILCLSGIIAAGLFGYMYYTKKQTLASQPKTTPLGPALPTISLSALSPVLDQEIGRFVNNVQESEYGYSMTVISYSPVYAYMIRNEGVYADEIAQAVGSPRDTSTTTSPFIFTDVTTSNQNMRLGTSASSTIVYAFVNNTQTLLIASTTERILSLRGAILH